jgi:hypothetical protein
MNPRTTMLVVAHAIGHVGDVKFFINYHVGGLLAILCSNLNSPIPYDFRNKILKSCQCCYMWARTWTIAGVILV